MTNGPNDLLTSEEATEPSGESVRVTQLGWDTIIPDNALCTREQIMQKSILRAHLYRDMATSHTRSTATFMDAIDASDSLICILSTLDLDVAVHRLCGGSFHNDVNRAALVGCNELSAAADKLHDFPFCDRVWYLLIRYQLLLTRGDGPRSILAFEILITPKAGGSLSCTRLLIGNSLAKAYSSMSSTCLGQNGRPLP